MTVGATNQARAILMPQLQSGDPSACGRRPAQPVQHSSRATGPSTSFKAKTGQCGHAPSWQRFELVPHGAAVYVLLQGPDLPTDSSAYETAAILGKDARQARRRVPFISTAIPERLPVATPKAMPAGRAIIGVGTMPHAGELPLWQAEGNGGHIWVFADEVRIKRTGVRGLVREGSYKGAKEISDRRGCGAPMARARLPLAWPLPVRGRRRQRRKSHRGAG